MTRLSIKIALLLLLATGCKNKEKDNIQSNSPDTTQASKSDRETPEILHIVAKPDTVAIDLAKTAVIVVDMENDFGAKGGMFDRAGLNISLIRKVINPTAKVLTAARQAGIRIIYLKMAYLPDLSDLGTEGSPNRMQHLLYMHVGDTMEAPNGSKSRILIRDNWGTHIIPELKPQANDIEIYKSRFSGFYHTSLDSSLKQLGIKHLIVTGCTTSVCVESTVRDAMFRDYSPVVLEDCVAEPAGYNFSRSNHEASLFMIQRVFGWVSNSNEFIRGMNKLPIITNQKPQ